MSAAYNHTGATSDVPSRGSDDKESNADSATLPAAQQLMTEKPPQSWRKSRMSRNVKRISRPSMRGGQFTFYREASPSGSTEEVDEAGLGAARGQQQHEPYDYSYDRVAPPAPIPEPMYYGMRQRTFRLLLAAIAIVAILAIGLGVGLGVGLKRKDSAADPDKPAAETASAPSTTPPTTTSTTPSSSAVSSAIPTSTSAPIVDLVSCPAANNTRYSVPGTNSTFLRRCGIDYSGVDQAKDLASVWTLSMQDCMFQCADYPGCQACGWGVIPGDEGSLHRCWLKSDLQSSHQSRAGWEFAILQ